MRARVQAFPQTTCITNENLVLKEISKEDTLSSFLAVSNSSLDTLNVEIIMLYY